VEDEAIIAAHIREALVHLGYEPVARVDAGEKAIAAAATLAPNLVLMDVHLRGAMDGIQAAKIIRERLSIPIVFLTAHSDEPTLMRATAAGAHGYVVKPFQDRDLNTAIRVALQRRALESRLEERSTLLEAILGAMGDAIVAVDAGGNVILANEPAAQIGSNSHNKSPPCAPTKRPPPLLTERRRRLQERCAAKSFGAPNHSRALPRILPADG
jgi:DNA-binding NarL/FixJ family response regulator